MMTLFFILAGCLILDIGLSAGFLAAFVSRHDNVVLGIGAALAVLYVAEIVAMCFFWHAAWRSIQDGHARTTPGKAIGLMFVPLFNLYWVFVLLGGFAKDCNAFCRRHAIGAVPRLPVWYFVTVAALWVGLVGLRYAPLLGHTHIQQVLRYRPTIGVTCGMVFSAAMLLLLYQTARAVVAIHNHSATVQTG